MAINIPLVHISDLTEKKTISDDDYMLTGGSTASKVKWSTIVSLIKTKLGIGNIENDISKIQSDISTLNSDFSSLQYKTYEIDGFIIKKNSQLAMIYMWYGKSLTGGNVNQTLLTLPNGITFNNEVFTPCEILDGGWTPRGNTGYITIHNNTVDVRCKDTTSYGVVIANVIVPASYINIP